MGWKGESAMSRKERFILAAKEEKTTFSKLCKDFDISRECGYKWARRHEEMGLRGLQERSRRPLSSPNKTPIEVEIKILEVRGKHPTWSGRKIRAYLRRQGQLQIPDPSTITRILHRYGRIKEEEAHRQRAITRFEHELPNQLWQMDFKGHFAIGSGRCHPLTIIDDHSRYSLGLIACTNEQSLTVEEALVQVFREHGLPERMTMDNGSPWGCPSAPEGYTNLEVWLIRLGIRVSHSRPYHPQTQGKDERFHRSLKEELLDLEEFESIEKTQEGFDRWRYCYNYERPHEACGMDPPASRYKKSEQPYPERLPYIDYDMGCMVRKVGNKGDINLKGERYFISESMRGLPVKITESEKVGILNVYLGPQKIKEIDLINKVVTKRMF